MLNILRAILGPLVQIVLAIVRGLTGGRVSVPSVPASLPAPPVIPPVLVEPSTTPVVPPPAPLPPEGPGPTEPVIPPPAPTHSTVRTPSKLYDRRANASKKHDYGHRDWSKVTGICLHQTACDLGENPPRYDSVGCHVGITKTGKVIWLHDFDRLIVHGNGWNTQTVGIEIDGLYAGVEGDPKTVWNDPSTPKTEVGAVLSQASIDSTREAIRWIYDRVQSNGGQLKALVAHRQASENRRNDPGSAIWKEIGLVMSEELNLSDGGAGFKIGKGYPIPESWDPKKKGIKY